MAINPRLLALLFAAVLCTTGCAPGIIYTDITRPLTRNMNETPTGTRSGISRVFQIREPVTNLRVGAEWSSTAIGDAAANGGLEKLYYADMRRQSAIFGIWRRDTIIVYGD